ncbi:MAG TPA: protein phosphatase 2C domain-containing protein [Pseudonocardiaceae bacterium]|jgi:protein phosphatase
MADVHPGLGIRFAARTDRGMVRRTNQDAAYAGSYLFAVADGFGVAGGDRTASAVAIKALEPLDTDHRGGNLLHRLREAMDGAQIAVREFIIADPARENTGTTLTAMLWDGAQFALGHVGDSRVYLLRGGATTQITHDHTYVQSLVDEGRMTPDEAASHPQRATLVRALHRDGTTEPDLHLREVRPGDRYLLCTDGLHAVVPEPRLSEVLVTARTPQEAADQLLALADDGGAPDNISSVIADVLTCAAGGSG